MVVKNVLDWLETWAPLIPLVVWTNTRAKAKYIEPVILYLFIAFCTNALSTLIWKQKSLGLTLPTDNNNPIYNFQSVARCILLSLFFIKLNQRYLEVFKMFLLAFFVLFVFLDLVFFENFFDRRIANNIHTLEAATLLTYCLMYYSFLLRNNTVSLKVVPSFWVATGLILFAGISFPVYLFYQKIIEVDVDFTEKIWVAQKLSFLIFCIFTAIGIASTSTKATVYE